MMVMIVKTSDDSSCPLCGDCSLINLAAEILPPWAKMRKAFPFLLLLLLFLYPQKLLSICSGSVSINQQDFSSSLIDNTD